ncbi:major facilitator superfamily MFS_1 [Methanobacterium lacus]|uniref:Major facilitator superfamily MFS_1 n=1 Tax=Methanobacterium lacus (strain AL-21) TaxID=877455 RepID=F0TCM5_METLA|nr:major facilitator superfamily MFS_1 [Methanobacterium lacus]
MVGKNQNKKRFILKDQMIHMELNGNNKVLVLLFIGVFMGSLDIGIVGPALPAVQSYFAVNERLLSWVFTIYILFFMIGTPLMAKLSDIYGRKTIYMLDIILFAIGSLITITSISFEMLLIGRAVQGVGAGGIFPVANAFIGDIFPPEKRGGALGIISSVWGISSVLGPILGGLLLKFGWQSLFIINLPISAMLLVGSYYLLPKTVVNRNIKFDWYGLAILSILVISLAYGLNQIEANNFINSLLSLSVLPYLILSLILLPVLWKVEKWIEDPLIQIDLFKSREVKLINTMMVGTGLIQAATIFIPAFVVIGLSLNSSAASLMLLPIVVTMAIGAPIIGKLLDKFGSKNIMITGSFIMSIGLLMLGMFPESLYLIIISGFLVGVGMSTAIGSPPRYIMLVESPAKERASGQALINIITSVGQLMGGALIGALIGSYAGTILGYQLSYFIMGVIALIMTILAFGLKSKKQQMNPS